MLDLIRKLHIYSGLVMFWALLVFAISGVHVMMKPDKRDAKPEVRRVPFTPPAGASDREIADLVRDEFGFHQSKPVPDWIIQRDEAGNLNLTLWSPNGYVTARVLQDEVELTIDRFGFGEYINQMHTHLPLGKRAWLAWIWSLYMELAIFGLMFLSASGIYLWAATRPRLWWARGSLVAGFVVVAYFYVAMR